MSRATCILITFALIGSTAMAEIKTAFIGTYTGHASKGIYAVSFNDSTGEIKQLGLGAETEHPSFVAVHKNGKYLYAVNETDEGSISAFKREPGSHKLKFINQKPSGGGAPCHINVDASGNYVLVANYSGGSVSVTRIQEDGSLGEQSSFVQHEGSSVDAQRQFAPHAHSINLAPGNDWAFVCDLGLDQVLTYAFDAETGKLIASSQAKLKPGSGPRHLVLNPKTPHAYAINEMSSTVSVLAYDAGSGRLVELQAIPTIPRDFEEHNSTAEVRVSADGRFVYGSNRGHDSIAVFRVGDDDQLTLIQIQPLGGKTPRNFNLDPSGRFLLGAAQNSNKINVFAIHAESGKLSPTEHSVEIPSPVCIRFDD